MSGFLHTRIKGNRLARAIFGFAYCLVVMCANPHQSYGAPPRYTITKAIDRALKANPTMVAVILKKIGWTCQKPVVRATQRDEEASKKWLQEKWPEIKKADDEGKRFGHFAPIRI